MLKILLDLLLPAERIRAFFLTAWVLVVALVDVIGIASIMPFIAVLSNPELIETNVMINKMFKVAGTFGVKTYQQFLSSLGVLVFIFLVISLSFRALTLYAQVRFLAMREYSLGKRLVEGYLHQPYTWFLNRHSAEIGKTVLSEAGKVVGKGLAPLMDLIK